MKHNVRIHINRMLPRGHDRFGFVEKGCSIWFRWNRFCLSVRSWTIPSWLCLHEFTSWFLFEVIICTNVFVQNFVFLIRIYCFSKFHVTRLNTTDFFQNYVRSRLWFFKIMCIFCVLCFLFYFVNSKRVIYLKNICFPKVYILQVSVRIRQLICVNLKWSPEQIFCFTNYLKVLFFWSELVNSKKKQLNTTKVICQNFHVSWLWQFLWWVRF